MKWMNWTDEQEQQWTDWVHSLPANLREIATRIRPDTLYCMKSTGQRVYPLSYAEDGTLTVAVDGQFNALIFERQVFGIDPSDLIECDLPSKDEPLGSFLDLLESAGETRQ